MLSLHELIFCYYMFMVVLSGLSQLSVAQPSGILHPSCFSCVHDCMLQDAEEYTPALCHATLNVMLYATTRPTKPV